MLNVTYMARCHIYLLLIFFGSLSYANNSTTKLDIEYFTKLPIARSVKLSPDGKHITLIVKHQGKDMLSVMSLETMSTAAIIQVKGNDKDVGEVYWVNNNRLIYTVKERGLGLTAKFRNGEIIGVNIDGSKHGFIFGRRSAHPSFGYHEIIDLLPNDDEHILIAFYPWKDATLYWTTNHDAKPKLYKLNIYHGKKSRLGRLPVPLAEGISDSQGQVRFSIGRQNNKTQVSYRDNNTSNWQPWHIPSFKGAKPIPIGFSDNDQKVYFTAVEKPRY